jgi:hypothetical protein
MENQIQIVPTVSNAATIYQRLSDPMQAIKEMGQMFAASGMFGCTKLEQGEVLALACLIENKSPFELMRNFHIIGGNLSKRSAAALAEFMKIGGKVEWHSALNNTEEACATFTLGESELPKAAYTIEDAKREGLTEGVNKHNWKVRAPDMMRARLSTKAVRMLAPGIMVGFIDETDEVPSAKPLLTGKEPEPTPKQDPELHELMAADGLQEKDAIAFLIERGRLESDKVLADLPRAARQKIAHNYPEFAAKVREFVLEK